MPRGKPRPAEKPVALLVHLPAPLAAELDVLLWDPALQKVAYGKKTTLVVTLLRQWIDQQKGRGKVKVEPIDT